MFTVGTRHIGFIKSYTFGGYEVDIGHLLDAFMPLRRFEESTYIVNPKEVVGTELEVEIIKHDSSILVAPFIYHPMTKDTFIDSINVGDIIEGPIVGWQDYGFFVKLHPDLDGFCHNNDIEWLDKNSILPRDYLYKGKKVSLKILDIDKDNYRIRLSYPRIPRK